ncbi:MAG: Ig-like domain-containing protein [Lachnospiraceae bacterium]|nr:Ig-like domain-containing protein [Lachnospiraceae bacterium]
MKKKLRALCLWLFLIAVWTLPVQAENYFFADHFSIQAIGKLSNPRILMIGNSHTFYNNLPQMLQAMCKNQGINATVDSVASGGHTLTRYMFPAEDNAGDQLLHQKVMKKLTEETWDYVIIQDAIDEPVLRAAKMEQAVAKIKSLVNPDGKSGTQLVLYMPWALNVDSSYERNQIAMAKTHYALATKYAAALAPSGLALAREKILYPQYNLYSADRRHMSLQGSYLSACTIFATLFGRNPEKLTYYAGLNVSAAKIFQSIAADVTVRRVAGGTGAQLPKLLKPEYVLRSGKEKQLVFASKPTSVRVVEWTSLNEDIASVSATGKVIAVGYGETKIRARLNNGAYVEWKIIVAPSTIKMGAGDKQTPVVSLKGYTWKTSKKSVAYVKSGKIYAKKAGTATVTGTNKQGTVLKMTIKVLKAPEKITIKNAPKKMVKGKNLKLKVSVKSGIRYKVSTSKKSVIRVEANGSITAVSAGTAKITVKTYNGRKASCRIQVVNR